MAKLGGLLLLVSLCFYWLMLAEQVQGGTVDWSLYSGGVSGSMGGSMEAEIRGRMLAGTDYYISYGALSANRSPCPAGSGRSYYTANCNTASGPARPYTRSCSAITRCARG